jgi:hypothetical protein
MLCAGVRQQRDLCPSARPASLSWRSRTWRRRSIGRARTREEFLKPKSCITYQRDADGDAVYSAGFDQVVGADREIMDEGVTQQAEHRLPGRKIIVITKLEAVPPLADGVEDEYSFGVKFIAWRPVAVSKVLREQEDNLAGLLQ